MDEKEPHDGKNDVPAYAYNKGTHNYGGLVWALNNLQINVPRERDAIIRLTNYGRLNTYVWSLLFNTRWSKIKHPGRFIIAMLKRKGK